MKWKHGIEPGVVIAFYLIVCAVEINAGGGDRADLEVTGAGVNLAVEAPSSGRAANGCRPD